MHLYFNPIIDLVLGLTVLGISHVGAIYYFNYLDKQSEPCGIIIDLLQRSFQKTFPIPKSKIARILFLEFMAITGCWILIPGLFIIAYALTLIFYLGFFLFARKFRLTD